MKSIIFQIPLKPISLNHSHEIKMSRYANPKTGRRRLFRGKSGETIAFEKVMTIYLSQIKEQMLAFSTAYDPTAGCIHVDAYFYIPLSDFFTKPKSAKNPRVHISRNSLDVDNCLKITLDTIFDYMKIDDTNVAYINAQKIPTDGDARMIFKLTVSPFPALNAFSADHLSHL